MMQKLRFTIESNAAIADAVFRMELACEDPEFLVQGEFVNVGIDGKFLRRPLSVCDRRAGHITLVYKAIWKGTEALSAYGAGRVLELLTGLGRGFDAAACKERALLVGGGLGVPPLLLLGKELKAAGKEVTAIIGFNRAQDIILADELAAVCDRVVISTVDGSVGVRGFVTDALEYAAPSFDYFYTCGPMVMMKAVCKAVDGPGEAGLEERMGCGGGFCYCCTITTKSGAKRVCKDGPVFKKEELIW